MNFIPVKRCNPYLSRRIGDVVGYVPHDFYHELLDAVFSGTVESWIDLPSNVQDVILYAENEKRIAMNKESTLKLQSLQRIDELKQQLDEIKTTIQSEKSLKMVQSRESIFDARQSVLQLKNSFKEK